MTTGSAYWELRRNTEITANKPFSCEREEADAIDAFLNTARAGLLGVLCRQEGFKYAAELRVIAYVGGQRDR